MWTHTPTTYATTPGVFTLGGPWRASAPWVWFFPGMQWSSLRYHSWVWFIPRGAMRSSVSLWSFAHDGDKLCVQSERGTDMTLNLADPISCGSYISFGFSFKPPSAVECPSLTVPPTPLHESGGEATDLVVHHFNQREPDGTRPPRCLVTAGRLYRTGGCLRLQRCAGTNVQRWFGHSEDLHWKVRVTRDVIVSRPSLGNIPSSVVSARLTLGVRACSITQRVPVMSGRTCHCTHSNRWHGQ